MAEEASVSRIRLHSGARSPRFAPFLGFSLCFLILSRFLSPSPSPSPLSLSLSLFEKSSRIYSPSRCTTQSCGKAAVRRRKGEYSVEGEFVSSETTEFYNAEMVYRRKPGAHNERSASLEEMKTARRDSENPPSNVSVVYFRLRMSSNLNKLRDT